MTKTLDCVIIGGGPGGLTAGIYLKRYRRNVVIIDDGNSRAAMIPLSHNYPGFPNGISGTSLLQRLRRQFHGFHGDIINDTIKEIKKENDEYYVLGMTGNYRAKTVILATGARDIEPTLPNVRDAVRRGLIHHCPICDGYEAIDRHIGVIASGDKGCQEALFLRTYSPTITLLSLGETLTYSKAKLAQLKKCGISIVTSSVKYVECSEKHINAITTHDGHTYGFDVIYSALGSIINSNMAIKLGAKNSDYYLLVNQQQQTNLPGLYAVGDVVKGLSQICVATAGAAIAATAIHNKLK